MDMTTSTPCPGCGQPVAGGRFCAGCGQRLPAAGDFSLRRLAAEAWEEASSLDSRLWRSVSGLLRPGRLTQDWLAYRWQRVHPPLRLYLVCSGIYFFLAWGVYFEASSQWLVLNTQDMPAAVRSLYTDPARAESLSDLTALMKFLFVVVMGAWVALLHRGNRMPAGAHMVWALHYTCMDFLLFSLAAPLVAFASEPWALTVSNLVTLGGIGVLFAWASLAVRRVYRRGWASSVARGAAVVAMDLVLSSLAGQVALMILLFRG